MASKGQGKAGKVAARGSKKSATKKSEDQKGNQAFTKGALRRLARRGGISRIGRGATE